MPSLKTNSSSRYVHVDRGLTVAYMDPTVRMSYGHAGDLIFFYEIGGVQAPYWLVVDSFLLSLLVFTADLA